MYDENNIFAKILRSEIPCDMVYEDKKFLFFNDINTQAKIHILGIPKMKVSNFENFILQADAETVKNFFSKAYDIVVKKKINKTGFKILTNSGKDGGQEVPHFHIHILGGEKLFHLR